MRFNSAVCVLALLCIAPRAFAQDDAPTVSVDPAAPGPSADELGAPQPGVTVPPAPAAQSSAAAAADAPQALTPQAAYRDYLAPPTEMGGRPHPVGAVFAELGLGMAGFSAGFGFTVIAIAVGYDRSDALFATGLILGPVLTFGLTNLGIYGAGRFTHGHGSFWWTSLGMVAGSGLGATLGFGLVGAFGRERYSRGVSDAGLSTGFILMPLLGFAGGVLAFEWSDRSARRRARGTLVPMVTPTRGGLTVGLAASF